MSSMAMAASVSPLSPAVCSACPPSTSRNSLLFSSSISSSSSSSSGSSIPCPALFYFSSVSGGALKVESRRPKRRTWTQVNRVYSGLGTDFSSPPIDVDADVRTEKIVILGGSGFVGSAIAKAAVKRGIEVVSLSRSGRPSSLQAWPDRVMWISGDVFNTDWDSVLHGATAVISTLGGFGTNEQMEKLNGDANILAVDAASNAGIKKFILVSVHDYSLPDFVLETGYFSGKRRAEEEVLAKYPNSGTILRPGPIYGPRLVNGIQIPLDLIGQPLERFLAQAETFTAPFSKLPAADLLLVPPMNVKDLALAAMAAVKDDTIFGILNIQQMKEVAATLTAV